MNTLIIDPSKVIFGRLGIAWCTSTNIKSDQSASCSWKRWFAKQAPTLAGNISIEMVQAFISAKFCQPENPLIDYRWGNKGALQDEKQRKSQIAPSILGLTSYYPCKQIGL